MAEFADTELKQSQPYIFGTCSGSPVYLASLKASVCKKVDLGKCAKNLNFNFNIYISNSLIY